MLFASRDGKDAVTSRKQKPKNKPQACRSADWGFFSPLSKNPYKIIYFLFLITPHWVPASCKRKKPTTFGQNQLPAREVPLHSTAMLLVVSGSKFSPKELAFSITDMLYHCIPQKWHKTLNKTAHCAKPFQNVVFSAPNAKLSCSSAGRRAVSQITSSDL